MQLLRISALVVSCTALLAAAPAITGIVNAASWVPPNLPNSGIAQGAIFTLTGTGLGPSTLQQASSYPLPTTQGLGGTAIQVTVGGVAETCIMVYTSSAQVAALLPSATPVGSGMLTLSYQGASSSIAIQVLAANFGTSSLNEGGTGPAVVTDTSYHPITMINAAHAGDTLILGTGLGAVTGDETEPPTAAVNLDMGQVQVLVGNQPATVSYAGRSSSPGLDQINFVVPAGVTGLQGIDRRNGSKRHWQCHHHVHRSGRANDLRRHLQCIDGGQSAKGDGERIPEHCGRRTHACRRRGRRVQCRFRELPRQQSYPIIRRRLRAVHWKLPGI